MGTIYELTPIGNDNRDNISRQSYAKRSFDQREIRTPWRGWGKIWVAFTED